MLEGVPLPMWILSHADVIRDLARLDRRAQRVGARHRPVGRRSAGRDFSQLGPRVTRIRSRGSVFGIPEGHGAVGGVGEEIRVLISVRPLELRRRDCVGPADRLVELPQRQVEVAARRDMGIEGGAGRAAARGSAAPRAATRWGAARRAPARRRTARRTPVGYWAPCVDGRSRTARDQEEERGGSRVTAQYGRKRESCDERGHGGRTFGSGEATPRAEGNAAANMPARDGPAAPIGSLETRGFSRFTRPGAPPERAEPKRSPAKCHVQSHGTRSLCAAMLGTARENGYSRTSM